MEEFEVMDTVDPTEKDFVKMKALTATDSIWDYVAQKIVLGGDDNLEAMQGLIKKALERKAVDDERKAIVQQYEANMARLVRAYSKAERETWDIQQYEAGQYLQTEDESLAPLLSEVLLGEVEGTTLKELCERVLAKAEPSKRMAGRLLAEKNRKLRELEEVKA